MTEKRAFTVVEKNSLPPNANNIGSHVIYTRRETGTVKARIVPCRHRDAEK